MKINKFGYLIIGGVIGLIISWQATSLYDAQKNIEALFLFKELEYYQMHAHCVDGYFSGDPKIALWELESMKTTIAEAISNRFVNENVLRFDDFVTEARLAKVYSKMDDDIKTEQHLTEAMKWKKSAEFSLTNKTSISNYLNHVDGLAMKHLKAKP